MFSEGISKWQQMWLFTLGQGPKSWIWLVPNILDKASRKAARRTNTHTIAKLYACPANKN